MLLALWHSYKWGLSSQPQQLSHGATKKRKKTQQDIILSYNPDLGTVARHEKLRKINQQVLLVLLTNK